MSDAAPAEGPSITTAAPQIGKLERFTPVLNKLFMNRVRGWIEEEFAFKNMDRTKKDMQVKYGVPTHSKIYNYKQSETRRISKKFSNLFPEEVKRDLKALNNSMFKSMAAVLSVGVVYYGGAFLMKNYSKWGRLTASGIFPKAVMYCVLLNTTNYFMLVRNSDEMEVILKHHAHYEAAIDHYEQQLLM